ncbi:hypothetical protein N0V93_002624 [Gnomoniopsis smithogilvyi]|uniref:Heme haloperoxidase family profile domain-containing protein n=1 Tax=Gnomoniopsis smithogilvyi TaxID=1191159 RepID=A0A9W8YWU1_9PEZI|nr:hypothetical protein N0V93_002624 [Gnomoniopsis smithogilvyi]
MYSAKAFFIWSTAALLANALDEATYPYQAPTSTDVRSPCPGINAAANHGILPRDGKNIDLDTLAKGLYTAYHLDYDAGVYVGSIGIKASSTGNASTFNLDDLAQHTPQVLEHDGSMSRNDSYWGDNLSFNDQAYARTLANWGDVDTITFAVAAAERKARVAYGVETNPEFNTTFGTTPSCLEYSLILSAFGDPVEGNGNATFIKYMFEKERIPIELGYQPPSTNITKTSALTMAGKIGALL